MVTILDVIQDTTKVMRTNKKIKTRLPLFFIAFFFFAIMTVGGSDNNDYLFLLHLSTYLVITLTGFTVFVLIAETPEFIDYWRTRENRLVIINAKFIYGLPFALIQLGVVILLYLYSVNQLELTYNLEHINIPELNKFIIIGLMVFAPFTSYAMLFWLYGRFLQFEKISSETGLPVLNIKRLLIWLIYFIAYLIATFSFSADLYEAVLKGEINSSVFTQFYWLPLTPAILFGIIIPPFLFYDGLRMVRKREDFVLFN